MEYNDIHLPVKSRWSLVKNSLRSDLIGHINFAQVPSIPRYGIVTSTLLEFFPCFSWSQLGTWLVTIITHTYTVYIIYVYIYIYAPLSSHSFGITQLQSMLWSSKCPGCIPHLPQVAWALWWPPSIWWIGRMTTFGRSPWKWNSAVRWDGKNSIFWPSADSSETWRVREITLDL